MSSKRVRRMVSVSPHRDGGGEDDQPLATPSAAVHPAGNNDSPRRHTGGPKGATRRNVGGGSSTRGLGTLRNGFGLSSSRWNPLPWIIRYGRPLWEACGNINFTQKMSAVSATLFVLLTICFAYLVSDMTAELRVIDRRQDVSRFYLLLGDAYVALEEEARLSMLSFTSVDFASQRDFGVSTVSSTGGSIGSNIVGDGNTLQSLQAAIQGGSSGVTTNGSESWRSSLPSFVSNPYSQLAANLQSGALDNLSGRLDVVQKATDNAMAAVFDASFGPASDAVIKMLFRSSLLADIRQRLNYRTFAAGRIQRLRQQFGALLIELANAMMATSTLLVSPHVSVGAVTQSAITTVGVADIVGLSRSAKEVVDMAWAASPQSADYVYRAGERPTSTSAEHNYSSLSPEGKAFNNRANAYLSQLFRAESLSRVVLTAGATGHMGGYVMSQTALTNAPWELMDALVYGNVWKSPPINLSAVTPETAPYSPATSHVPRSLLQRLQMGGSDSSDSIEYAFMVVYSVLIALSSMATLYLIGRWVQHQQDKAQNEVAMRNAGIMHAVSVRVSEYVEALATFSLDVPAPPRVMQGTAVGVVETQLQLCLASLRAIAPTLPPLLFPQRLARLAAIGSEVCDSRVVSERIAATVAPRDTLTNSKITLLDVADIDPENNIYCQSMATLTELAARKTNAVVVTVDTFFFHDVCTPVRKLGHVSMQQHQQQQLQREQWAHHAYQRFVSCVEECVYQYGGVVHFAGLDRITAVWVVDGNGVEGGSGVGGEGHHHDGGRRGRDGDDDGHPMMMLRSGSRASTARVSIFGHTANGEAGGVGGNSYASDPHCNVAPAAVDLLPFMRPTAAGTFSYASGKGPVIAPNMCDPPAMCALAISSRLTQLKKANAGGIADPFKLWATVPVYIGVTAGPVVLGTFGTQTYKTIQLYGEPLMNGLSVARVNQYSLTSVVCDEAVRRVIESQRLRYCKPVEVLEGVGRVYEIIPPNKAMREVDLEAKLAAYRSAFDMYEGKFFREALRAFRAYTKQYGYDRSVERLQAVITGL